MILRWPRVHLAGWENMRASAGWNGMARNGPLPQCEPGELGDRAGGQATPAQSEQEMSMTRVRNKTDEEQSWEDA